jgi:hypothetical protein
MSRKTLVFVCVILGLLVFLGGCAVQVQVPVPVPERVLLAQFKNQVLDENWYVYKENIAIDKMGRVYGYIDLTHWPGHYGLEILFMTMDSFAAYDGGESFSAWHQSFYTEGRHNFEFKDVPPGNYALVVDNTDRGWERTDFDFVNDYAVFDLEVYFETY